ncbi:MAG: hypothetical protein QY320_06245 [Gammaproteobacteria bacterium]|nr:MAG: hypothetical protein QY320_06245 [Gammaproteobacteria bacterium]
MAHIARVDAAVALSGQLDADISLDPGDRGETRNGDIAWTLHDPGADWHLVLQDDALPIPQFRRHVTAALLHAPETAVSFYIGTGRPLPVRVTRAIERADRDGNAWLEHQRMLWGVAIAMPTGHIARFLTWGKLCDAAYDRRIGLYWAERKQLVRYTWPSLVDHVDGPTLIKHPWGEPRCRRVAHGVGFPKVWQTGVTRI